MGESGQFPRTVAGANSSRVTISMLADSLDLSKGTVSKALNGYGDVSELTKARVAEAADRLGYRPLGHAQAIRTGRIKSVGLVLQLEEHDGYGFFLRDFLAGISQATSARGWTLTVASASSHGEFEDVASRLVEQRKVDGFILPRTQLNDSRYVFLSRMGVHSVLFGRLWQGSEDRDPEASWYDIDGEFAFADAVLRMKRHGHRRIGFVGAPEEYTYAHIRKAGYLLGLSEAGLETDDSLIIPDMRTREDGERATEILLSLPEPPTAIIFSTDETATGAYSAAARLGLKLGRDLSISAYDGAARGSFMIPSLSSYRVDMGEAGSRLSSLLISRVEGAPPDSLREVAAAQFVKGGTDGPPALSPHELAERASRAAVNSAIHQN